MGRIIFIFLVLLTSFSCNGQSDCVFSESSLTDEFLKKSEQVITYNWDDESKEGQAILANGGVLLVEKWACYDFGVSSSLLLKKNVTTLNNWKKHFIELSNITNNALEHELLLKEINQISELDEIKISENLYESSINHPQYPEYFISIDVLSNSVVFSLFHYRN